MNVSLHISVDELRALCAAAIDSGSFIAESTALEILECLKEDAVKDGDTIDMVF